MCLNISPSFPSPPLSFWSLSSLSLPFVSPLLFLGSLLSVNLPMGLEGSWHGHWLPPDNLPDPIYEGVRSSDPRNPSYGHACDQPLLSCGTGDPDFRSKNAVIGRHGRSFRRRSKFCWRRRRRRLCGHVDYWQVDHVLASVTQRPRQHLQHPSPGIAVSSAAADLRHATFVMHRYRCRRGRRRRRWHGHRAARSACGPADNAPPTD